MHRAPPSRRGMSLLLLLLCLALGVAAIVDLPGHLRYWRNYLAYGFSEPDRQLRTEKYSPVATLATGAGTPPPAGALAAHHRRALDDYFLRSDAYAVLVARKGRLVYARYAEGLGHETMFDAWSMSKTLVALATGYALDRGLIDSVDAPVGRWLSEWADDPRGQITIRQLLNNESGLENRPFSFDAYNEALDYFVGTDLEATVLSTRLARAPGSAFEFNHINSQTLILLLERIAGKPYAALLKEYLWQPLEAGAAAVPLDRPGGLARGVCCFLSSALNWLKLGMVLAQDGAYAGRRIVSRRWIGAMTRPAPRNRNFGFALWLGPFGDRRLVSEVSGRADLIRGSFRTDGIIFAEGSGGVRLYLVPGERLVIVRFGAFQGFPVPDHWDEAALVNVFFTGATAD